MGYFREKIKNSTHAPLTYRQHSRRKGETPDVLAQRREHRQDVQNFFGQECWVLERCPDEGETYPTPFRKRPGSKPGVFFIYSKPKHLRTRINKGILRL